VLLQAQAGQVHKAAPVPGVGAQSMGSLNVVAASKQQYHTSWWTQTTALVGREVASMTRNPYDVVGRWAYFTLLQLHGLGETKRPRKEPTGSWGKIILNGKRVCAATVHDHGQSVASCRLHVAHSTHTPCSSAQ
jgi:hypothetical protein